MEGVYISISAGGPHKMVSRAAICPPVVKDIIICEEGMGFDSRDVKIGQSATRRLCDVSSELCRHALSRVDAWV